MVKETFKSADFHGANGDKRKKVPVPMSVAVFVMIALTFFNFRQNAIGIRRQANLTSINNDGWYNTAMGAMMGNYYLYANGTITNNDADDLDPQRQQSSSPAKRGRGNFIPLPDLVRIQDTNIVCPQGMQIVPQVSDPVADLGIGRKIPKVVHMTGSVKCTTPPFIEAIRRWTWQNYSFYYHDDEAVDRLLFEQDWPMFPQIKNAMECLKNAGGAAKADLWRYLALWEYGGIYTDMDNAPGELFNASTLTPDIDAFFLPEQGGFPSQYFFAVSPKHPIMFFAVHDVMNNMHTAEDTGKFYVPFVTGPGSIKRSMIQFGGRNKSWTEEMMNRYAYPTEGLLHGIGNRTVTIAGSRATCNNWVVRGFVRGPSKSSGFEQMNITNYQSVNKMENGLSCIRLLHDKYSVPLYPS